jgi:hypothetical protein
VNAAGTKEAPYGTAAKSCSTAFDTNALGSILSSKHEQFCLPSPSAVVPSAGTFRPQHAVEEISRSVGLEAASAARVNAVASKPSNVDMGSSLTRTAKPRTVSFAHVLLE